MKIAVIGTGLSGLAAARELTHAGHEVTVFEKSSVLGGRLASHRAEINGRTVIFDAGAQNIKAPGSALDRIARELLPADEILPITAPVWLHDRSQIIPGDAAANAEPKWTCRNGLAALPETLARGLDVRVNTGIGVIHDCETHFELEQDTGTWLRRFERLIISAPSPVASNLISGSDLPYAYTQENILLDRANYRSCLSLMLWFDAPLDAPWYALLATDRAHPLLWLARTNLADSSAPGTALVAQFGPEWSQTFFEVDDESVLQSAVPFIADLLGTAFKAPAWSSVERWRHAQPASIVDFDAVNIPGARIIFCGDGLAGGKAHLAYDSGLRAAQFVLHA